MKLQRLFIGVLVFSVIVSCQTVPAPIEDYSLARAALDAARSVQAARYSPGNWHQAEEAYRKGRIYFNDRDFAKAQEQFIRAKAAAERAENSARAIRQRTGDIL